MCYTKVTVITKNNWHGLRTRLQEGEAPEEVGAVLQQRSRWAKGHMQVRLEGLGRTEAWGFGTCCPHLGMGMMVNGLA